MPFFFHNRLLTVMILARFWHWFKRGWGCIEHDHNKALRDTASHVKSFPCLISFVIFLYYCQIEWTQVCYRPPCCAFPIFFKWSGYCYCNYLISLTCRGNRSWPFCTHRMILQQIIYFPPGQAIHNADVICCQSWQWEAAGSQADLQT